MHSNCPTIVVVACLHVSLSSSYDGPFVRSNSSAFAYALASTLFEIWLVRERGTKESAFLNHVLLKRVKYRSPYSVYMVDEHFGWTVKLKFSIHSDAAHTEWRRKLTITDRMEDKLRCLESAFHLLSTKKFMSEWHWTWLYQSIDSVAFYWTKEIHSILRIDCYHFVCVVVARNLHSKRYIENNSFFVKNSESCKMTELLLFTIVLI